jgi:FMN phosphatase YigB (HAD superfamily)
MVSTLFQKFDLENIQGVGFDMDGTLYREYDFIDQVYSEIAQKESICLTSSNDAETWIKNRWIEKGSSYPFIFGEVHDRFGVDSLERNAFISRALDRYRNFMPTIFLSKEVRVALDFFKENYPIFLISDGNHLLQRNKFKSLGLGSWFDKDQVFFTGDFGPTYQKPSTNILSHITLSCAPENILYFGDRKFDEDFCVAAGFRFQMVNIMEQVK